MPGIQLLPASNAPYHTTRTDRRRSSDAYIGDDVGHDMHHVLLCLDVACGSVQPQIAVVFFGLCVVWTSFTRGRQEVGMGFRQAIIIAGYNYASILAFVVRKEFIDFITWRAQT